MSGGDGGSAHSEKGENKEWVSGRVESLLVENNFLFNVLVLLKVFHFSDPHNALIPCSVFTFGRNKKFIVFLSMLKVLTINVQLDLGYIRPSVIRISLWSSHDLAVYCLLSILSIFNYSLAQDKNKVVNICFILLSKPFYMSDNLLQIRVAMSK